MLNSLTLCFISFLGGVMIGMGTVLFVQGAFYNDAEKKYAICNSFIRE